MSTLRFNSKQVKKIIGNNTELQKQLDNWLTRFANSQAKNLENVLEYVYQRGVMKWWKNFKIKNKNSSYERLLKSIEYSHTIRQTRSAKKRYIVIDLYAKVNVDTYTSLRRRSIDAWKKGYAADVGSEYIINLLYSQGIMGLPQYWTRPNPRFPFKDGTSSGIKLVNEVTNDDRWLNPNFMQETPLYEYLGGKNIEAGYIRREFKRTYSHPERYMKK